MKPIASLAAIFALNVSATAYAHGDVRCSTPKAEWRPQVELQGKLVQEDWKVRRIKVENGCYEVYGFDAKGERTEAFFNPKTFERILPTGEPVKK